MSRKKLEKREDVPSWEKYTCPGWFPPIESLYEYKSYEIDDIYEYFQWIVDNARWPVTTDEWLSICIMKSILKRNAKGAIRGDQANNGKTLVSYDEFEALCNKMDSLPPENRCKELPLSEDLLLFLKEDFHCCLPYYVWVTETYGRAKTMEEDALLKHINEIIREHAEFVETLPQHGHTKEEQECQQ